MGLGIADAQAQTTSTHGKATGTPEKTPDGTWDSLKPAQQQILQPLEADWDYMLPESRKRWTQVANLYPKMSEQDQQRLQSRMGSWSNLSQRDRRNARENYLSSLNFPADKKAEAWSAYQKLSDDEKKKLAQSAESKKKPTVANAPTLQQHPLVPKAILPPAAAIRVITAPPETPSSTSSGNAVNAETNTPSN